ncbi:hypothetical protein AGDE_10145 [Angomonas deanei]|uniref:Right handed beta helix region/Periplasmic copper-binding protein (NosD), putative n=1 Tax=Angomonas deanei TaxID=59799 RepID=A0A7G2CMX1_9TRYP|nr:hypothetical protein AGDE_10145 [Angomonas deanei]CAD2221176.1 Right handed beta helix region/Periplasmic copper-binding protein (NosD), putative [Angomonas deanei]|eukprot:EPY29061.1 hypothetical protein AGDE_10145 [Angomonas deanei]
MTAIDISVLTERLVHSPPDSQNYSETLKHTLNFVQFFSQRAADFICLAEKYAVPSTAQLARPETENKSTSPVQLSPPRRARTDTPHVHRTQSSNERDPIVRPFAIPKYAPPSDEEEEEEAPATPLPTVVSIEPQANTGAPVIEQRLRDNASFSLGSGIYYENLKFDNCGDVELSAAVAGDPVLFRPHSAAEPLITVVGPHSNATFNNLVFVFGELTEFEEDGEGFRYDPHIPTVPLVSIVSGATATFNGCHFYKGGAAGVLASDEGTRVEMNYCFLAKCAFGAVFARHYSTVSLHHCRLKYCEAGARISTHSTMHFTETSVEKSGVDGVVVHEGGTVALHRCSVSQNGGNGLLISSGASAVVSECTVSENALYGIQRTSGSNVRLLHSSIQNNGLSSVSEGSVNL